MLQREQVGVQRFWIVAAVSHEPDRQSAERGCGLGSLQTDIEFDIKTSRNILTPCLL